MKDKGGQTIRENVGRMKARYEGTCRICGGAIVKGEEIVYAKGYGARHLGCTRVRRAQRSQAARDQEAWYAAHPRTRPEVDLAT